VKQYRVKGSVPEQETTPDGGD
jgi:hypothetical protein